jgi:hypothetical protein
MARVPTSRRGRPCDRCWERREHRLLRGVRRAGPRGLRRGAASPRATPRPHDQHARNGPHHVSDGDPAGRHPDHRALHQRARPRPARRHPHRHLLARRAAGPAAGDGAVRTAPEDLLRPGEDPRRDRHLRRPVSWPQRRDRRPRPHADLPLPGTPGGRHPQRLPGLRAPLQPRRRRPHPRVGARHRHRRRHRARHLPRPAGPRGDRRLPRAAARQRPVRSGRRRVDARGDADRAHDRRPRPPDRGRRNPEDDRQRHPLHRPAGLHRSRPSPQPTGSGWSS